MADIDKTVFSAGLITIGSTTAASVLPPKFGGKGSLPDMKTVIGTGLTFFGLSTLGDYAPGLAGPLALCIAMTALTYYGVPVLNNYLQDNNKNKVGLPKEKE